MNRFGRYEILEELGRGGFATVFKARDTQLNRRVALKVLHAGWSGDPEFVRRFRQEAETVANFRHPNIVVIHDVGEIDRQLFIAMEYLPGENLHLWLERKAEPLTLTEALPILRQVAGALDYAHSRNVIHRDIKPSNLIIQDSAGGPEIVLTDFGLVKAMESSVALTMTSQMLGSPEYMAPEQADPNRAHEIGSHSDRYAFGIVAYQMFAGRVPFPGHSISTLNAHANLQPPSPREFNEAMPEEMVAVVLRMLAKNPAERFASGQAFVEALEAIAGAASRVDRREDDAERLYTRLQEERATADWVEVVALAARITTLHPGYRDVDELQADARRRLARAQPTGPTKSAQRDHQVRKDLAAPTERKRTYDDKGISGKRSIPGYVWGLAGIILMGLIWYGASSLANPEELPSITEPEDTRTTTPAATQTATPDPSVPPKDPQVGDTWTRPADEMVMVYAPSGTFMMGSNRDFDPDADDDERPPHLVGLDGFWIDKYEVTHAQYERCVDSGQCDPPEHDQELASFMDVEELTEDDRPVVGVTWFDAGDYCAWAGGNLPTEAQWEYAARGPESLIYPWGNEFDGERLNFCDASCTYEWRAESYDDGYELTAPVGSYPDGASWIGAEDMAGNVFEWTADWYSEEYYSESPPINPTGPQRGTVRAFRGGAWPYEATFERSANRILEVASDADPSDGSPVVGIRCAYPGPPTDTVNLPLATQEPTPTDSEPLPLSSSTPETDDPGPLTYVIQAGDTLAMISQLYDVPMDDIMAANGLDNTSALFVGQELIIPIGGKVPATPTPDLEVPPLNASLGSTWTRPTDEEVMVFVPAGSFMMGSNPDVDPDAEVDEQPPHTVALDAFWLDRSEVTNAQYGRCVKVGECDQALFFDREGWIGDEQPVTGVSWEDAETYCEWAGGSLPTEAQWEYAARGPDGLLYPWGNEFDDTLLNFCDANCQYEWRDDESDDGFAVNAPVGSYPRGASWVGAFDLAGNVLEYTADWYDEEYYRESPPRNPAGPPSGEMKAMRGGSWFEGASRMRSADRFAFPPDIQNTFNFGFRCALDAS